MKMTIIPIGIGALCTVTKGLVLYSHMQIHIYIYTSMYMQNNSQRHNDKGRAKSSLEKYVPLTLL